MARHCTWLLFLWLYFGVLALSKSKFATRLTFDPHRTCTYSYELMVNTVRGSKSMESEGIQIHALVDVTLVTSDYHNHRALNLLQLDIREPRLRRVRGERVLINHPVNEEFEEQLSRPFYFRQHEHGPVADVMVPKDESPEVAAFKKGVAGAFQLDLKNARKLKTYKVKEHDDSGSYYSKYTVTAANDSHILLKKTWTNFDYEEFADGAPVRGEHRVQSQHSVHVHVKDGRINVVHRKNEAHLRPSKGHPRAENLDTFPDQDVELLTRGYSRLTLLSCDGANNRRTRRSLTEDNEQVGHMKTLRSESLVFRDVHRIKWNETGENSQEKTRPLYELIRCFSDKSVKELEIADCSRQLMFLIRNDKSALSKVCDIVTKRTHQNSTTWRVLVSSLAWHGTREVQDVLANALKSGDPRTLSKAEYVALLGGIFNLPKGPLHCNLFDALFEQAVKGHRHKEVSAMAMLVLSGLVKRAQLAGFNETLHHRVAELIHTSYQNKSKLYQPDTVEHESYLRNHIWAFGNLGHVSGLSVLLEHVDHDSSGIRSAVMSAMRKLPQEHTDYHLIKALYEDEHNDVKAAVVDVFIERHQDLEESMVTALEHALWYVEDGDSLDASIQELLENHGKNHPKVMRVRKKRSTIRRQKRALLPELRPREYRLGKSKIWGKTYGGKWIGAETGIRLVNQARLRLGIFGGSFDINVDNNALVRAHLLMFGFDVALGKAAFKASASFKNDIPKDLIHSIADAGDDILKYADGFTNILVDQIDKIKEKLRGNLPLTTVDYAKFVNTLVRFVENLSKPMKPIKLISKVMGYAKYVQRRQKSWAWMMDKARKIQFSLNKLTFLDKVFLKAIAVLDGELQTLLNITEYLPHKVPDSFRIEDLFRQLEGSFVSSFHRFNVPGMYHLQPLIKSSVRLTSSLEKFEIAVTRLSNFANMFLDLSSFLETFKSINLPKLSLPKLEVRYPTTARDSGFGFGLEFDWKSVLRFDIDLESHDFQQFIAILQKLDHFFDMFKSREFNLETFFEDILPGRKLDIQSSFPELLQQESSRKTTNPASLFVKFIEGLLATMDQSLPNVTAISDMADFFGELGPVSLAFEHTSVHKLCNVYKLGFEFSHQFEFGKNVEKEGIQVLEEFENMTQTSLKEMLKFTAVIDSLVIEVEQNFTRVTKEFVSNSLQELRSKLQEIQNLVAQTVDFTNSTTSEVTGVCSKAADVSAKIIDNIKDAARKTLTELDAFIGPLATDTKKIAQELSTAVIKVETWLNENVARRTGKVSRIARILSEFLSVIDAKKGFLGTVRKVAVEITEALQRASKLHDYANEARQVSSDITDFSQHVKLFKKEIRKLDLPNALGADFDQKIQQLCDNLKGFSAGTVKKYASVDVVEDVSAFFTKESEEFISKALEKFGQIRKPIHELHAELQDFSISTREVRTVLESLRPLMHNFSSILVSIAKLPNCRHMKTVFTESIKSCVSRALSIGKDTLEHYTELKKEAIVLLKMIPETWRNFKMQKCVKGGECISKDFINQARGLKDKIDKLRKQLQASTGLSDILGTCKEGIENITAIVETVIDLREKASLFSSRDDVRHVKKLLARVTGLSEESRLQRRSIGDGKENAQRIVDYVEKSKEMKQRIKLLVTSTFKGMKSVYEDAISGHTQKINEARNNLQSSFKRYKKIKNVDVELLAVNTLSKAAYDYVENFKVVTSSFPSPVWDLQSSTEKLTNIIKPHLEQYDTVLTNTQTQINTFLDEITDFLNKLQLRQRSLDPRDYKPWDQYPYCSERACVRSIRRSSGLYYSTIFPWKFPHLDDLSSMNGAGRWLTPGLFDDYKVEGIAQLSEDEMLLGMYGVARNKDKASLLVVTDLKSSNRVKKIIELGSSGDPFSVVLGGIAIARSVIWISDSRASKIYSVSKSAVTSSLSSVHPSWVSVSNGVSVEGVASSVSYDEEKNFLWVTDGNSGKSYGYRLSAGGYLVGNGLAPNRVIYVGMDAQGMALVNQFGVEYVCVSRCKAVAGFQCRLEFHDLTFGDQTGPKTLARVVRVPSGLESIQAVKDSRLAVTFSSGTFTDKEKIDLIRGEVEDRYFRILMPILKTTFGISENCLMFRVMGDDIFDPRPLFPVGDLQCGSRRTRSLEQRLLDSDVYSADLELIHKGKKRVRRDSFDAGSCMRLLDGEMDPMLFEIMPEYSIIIVVYGIPVRFFYGVNGYFSMGWTGQVCMKQRTLRFGLVPGAWITAYAGASVFLYVVEAGVTLEATILQTYLIPELRVKLDRWPLQACIELKLLMTPLRITVYLWYRLHRCISVDCWRFGCRVNIEWCERNIIWQWGWSARTIERTLFTNCKADVDRTKPFGGTCSARQVSDTSYFIQWNGFQEDTRITDYRVLIGSVEGSGDDFGIWAGNSLSLVASNLKIMHGRDVYVSVFATNAAGLDSRFVKCPQLIAKRRNSELAFVHDGPEPGVDLDYQSNNNTLGMNYAIKSNHQEVISVKWGVSSLLACTRNDSEADIFPMTSLGDSTVIQTYGLKLNHGSKYYTRVLVINNIGLKTIMCSDGIVIDTTPPISGYLWDGAGEDDRDFIPSLKRVRARFSPFHDPESPIIKYEWKIVMKSTETDYTSFVGIPLSQATPMMNNLSLDPGSIYYIILRGTNAAGLQTTIASNGFVPDVTVPYCPIQIFDVTSQSDEDDADFVRELKSIQAKWKCIDNESGIQIQLACVGTYPGGADIVPFSNLNISQENDVYSVRFNNFTIRPEVRYHVTVKVFNGAKLKRTITSDGILIDTTPPAVAAEYIRDGSHGRDKNFTSERFSFSAHWEQAFTDAESGLVEYRVALGTKPGLDNTKEFTSVGSNTSVTITRLLLESGRRYYVTVTGCNAVGMCINGSSNGAVVDFVPPHTGDVITGYQGPPQYYQWLTKSAWARWDWCPADENRGLKQTDYHQCNNDSFYDVHSGIAAFGISVVSLKTDLLLAPLMEVGRAKFSGRSISMEDGIYSVVIEARDRAGVRSRGLSNTFIVDSSPPVIAHVQHGVSGDPVQYTNARSLTFTASFEIEDDLSKITEYRVGIGSYTGVADVIEYQSFHLPVPVSFLRANWTAELVTQLENRRKYYVTVWAINRAGLVSIRSSAPLQADFEPPRDGVVMDGWGFSDAQFHSYSSIYRVHWKGFTDISGIKAVAVGLSTRYDCHIRDVKSFAEVQGSSEYFLMSGLNLTSGIKHYACLKLVDKAGNEAVFSSNGVLVDTTPPLPGTVTDGIPGEDRAIQTEGSVLRASWAKFLENETQIVTYKLAFGTAPGSVDVQEFTDVGLVTSSASSRLKVSELISGQRYYASVVAYNLLGVPSFVTSSNGVLVDVTPPAFNSSARDGLDAEVDLQSTSKNFLSVTWRCQDPETSVNFIQVAFGLQPGESDVVNFTTVTSQQNSFSMSKDLRQGYRYFATVRCVNQVGLKSLSISDGIIYDNTAPKGIFIEDKDYQRSSSNVSLKWKFLDLESRIVKTIIQVYRKDSQGNITSMQGPFIFNQSVTFATVEPGRPLSEGVRYYANVTAINQAGLQGNLESDGFVVDTSSPVCIQVWDGDGEPQNDVQFVPKTTKLTISWNCYDQESPLVRYRYAVKNTFTGEILLPFHTLKNQGNSSGTALITGGGQLNTRYEEGNTYSVGIEVTNAVLMKSVYWTNGVVVDGTPPVLKDLKSTFDPKTNSLSVMWKAEDQQSGLKGLYWHLGTAPDSSHVTNFTEVPISKTNVSITGTSLVQGKTYFLSLFAVNKAGLSSRTTSTGIIIDRTAPNTGIVTAHYVFPKSYNRSKNYVSGASFVAAWTGFIDSESGVDQYSWAVGTNLRDIKQKDDSLYTVITDEDSVGGTVIENQTLSSNTTYFVCIRVTNGAGLQRTDCSLGMLVILGKFSPGTVNDGPLTNITDIDFQMDDKAIWAHWDGFKDPVFGISQYDWCIGDQPPGMSNVCQWPYMEIHHLKTSAHRFHNLTLSHGTKYYVTVKAENTRGETVSSTSDGVTVDRTPPIGKAIHVSPATGKETLYVTSPSAPVVTWSMEDPESGIKYFLVGVGSFPRQDDITSFIFISGLRRSVDLDTLNLTLSEGLSFYVTVRGVNMLGLETTLTSQEVVVDWSPPVGGRVLDGNVTSSKINEFVDTDYQGERGVLSSHWDTFEDRESGIMEYHWCVGTTRGSCETLELMFVGLETSIHYPIILQEGVQYYVTVEATNRAGLKERAFSDGITVDTTPPELGDIQFETISKDGTSTDGINDAMQSNGRIIRFSWTRFEDRGSTVSQLEWCAGSKPKTCNLVPWLETDPQKLSTSYSFFDELKPGTSLYVTLAAANGAGVTSYATSKELLIDTTAPLKGRIFVGNTRDLKYLREGNLFNADWIGFEDTESGLSHYEWAVCQTLLNVRCITPFTIIGQKTSLASEALDLKPHVSYVFVVRAYNKVGLFTEATSNPFIIEKNAATPSQIFDGNQIGMDKSIQTSLSLMSANWKPFKGSVLSYAMCIGSAPGLCDVNEYVNVGDALQGTISGLYLNQSGYYFVNVRAQNNAGYYTHSSSNGVHIDSTPPVEKEVRDGQMLVDIDLQPEDNFISANWDEFEDPESGIAKYEWCAGTKQGSCDVIAQTDVGESTTTISQHVSPLLTTGMQFYVTLTVHNGAGAITRVFTDGVMVDNTGPIISKVVDLQINKTERDLDFITARDQYCLSWDTADPESGVVTSKVSICTTVNPEDCLVRNADAENRSSICMADLEFVEGIEYAATVRVINNLGISLEMSSDGFVIDSTAPNVGEIVHVENSAVEDEHFTHSLISVEWDGFWDKESGISKYFVCIGTRPGECDVRNFTEATNKTHFATEDSSLLHGKTYFVSVVAENRAGFKSTIKSSHGVTVDTTGPVGGKRVYDGKESTDIDAQQSTVDIVAHWHAFDDLESDVIEVTYCAGTSPGKCDIITQTKVQPDEYSFYLVLNEPMNNGQRYYTTVQATNGAGLMTSMTSDGVTVDAIPPFQGEVIDGDVTDVDFLYGDDDVTARWFNFSDPESGVQSYEVAVCDARNISDCPQAFVNVGQAENITLRGLDLEPGARYVIKVRATNPVRLQTEASSDGFTVDFSPPFVNNAQQGHETKDVKYQSDATQLLVSWLPFVDTESGILMYEVCIGLNPRNCDAVDFIAVGLRLNHSFSGLTLKQGSTYYATVRGTNAIGLSSVVATNGVLIDLTPPQLMDGSGKVVNKTDLPNNNSSFLREDSWLYTDENHRDLSRVQFRCTEDLLNAQWPEFKDPESELQGYEWCVGTTAAECDVWPLSFTGTHHQAAAIVEKISTGTELFATVNAVNRAGLKTRLISDKCTVISVSPRLMQVIDLSNASESNISDIDWKAAMKSLSLGWDITPRVYEGGLSMRIQLAFTRLAINISVPRLLTSRSWYGERLVHDFMDVLPQQRNATVRTVPLEAWQSYRGIVRVSNGGDIFAEKGSDGVRIEPSPPPRRKLVIRDEAAEKEHLRWWPLLRLPPVNHSAIDPDVMYISSPQDLVLMVSEDKGDTNSSSSNESSIVSESNLFSPTKDFKISVVRVTSGTNETNTTEETQAMKSLQARANPGSPCCVNVSNNPLETFTEMHLKPTLTRQHFGSSVAFVSDGYLAITSAGKGHLFSIHKRSESHPGFTFESLGSSAPAKVAAYGNITAFLFSKELHVYETKGSANRSPYVRKVVMISICKAVSTSKCGIGGTWADSLENRVSIHNHIIAIRGRLTATNNTVVGVFLRDNGVWKFAKVIGQNEGDSSFGHSMSLNQRLIAVSSARRQSTCALVYSKVSWNFIEVCINDASKVATLSSLHVTQSDALIMVSRNGTVSVVQLIMDQKTHSGICNFTIRNNNYVNDALDADVINDGIVVALAIQTPQGRHGVQLFGFNGPYAPQPSSNGDDLCVDLGRVVSPQADLRVYHADPTASIALRGSKIMLGIPGVFTWPDLNKNAGTGQVYITTYCPRDHFREKTSRLGGIDTFTCTPCPEGQRSFGGFTTSCSVCLGRTCPPPGDDPSTFNTSICDVTTCPSVALFDNKTWGVTTTLANESFFLSGALNVYTVKVLETTRVDVSTTSYSESFIIDCTPPTPGVVYDGPGSDQNHNCSQNETFGEDSQCSSRDFQDTDVDYTNNTAEIHARWIDFLDNQSDIIEYFWCVGSRPMRDDILECESTGLRPNGSHYGLSLQNNETYYVTVVACNGARRCSAAHSDGVTIDTTPPIVEYVRDGIMGPDMDFQAFLDLIFAYYYASDPDSGIKSYEVGWGTAPNLTDIRMFEEVGNTTIWFAKLKDGALKKGIKYYASVRATNGAGLLSDRLSSNGIVVGKSEYIFDNETSASFFFDTVDVNVDGTREDGGVGKTYGTLDVPEGAVQGKTKLRCYSLDEQAQAKNMSDEGPISNPKKTLPKQFKLGNYSFQIKALDPETNTVQEGYRFEKPITLSMFYDVDNLVKANKDVVSNEVEKEDIDPVLYLWDPKNESWFDASLTCPEPWSHVNRSIKLLTVHVCHLTQFAFFWSFRAQNGLVLFNKNNSVYDNFGHVNITRVETVTEVELPIKRAKGASGNITVKWSLFCNTTEDCRVVWPYNGLINMKEGQWNSSIVLNVDNDEQELPEQVVWVQLVNISGGAVLASGNLIKTKMLVASNMKDVASRSKLWPFIGVGVGMILLVALIVVVWFCVRKRRYRSERITSKEKKEDSLHPTIELTNPVDSQQVLDAMNPIYDGAITNQYGEEEMETTFSGPSGLVSERKTKERPLSQDNPIYDAGPQRETEEWPLSQTNPIYDVGPESEERTSISMSVSDEKLEENVSPQMKTKSDKDTKVGSLASNKGHDNPVFHDEHSDGDVRL